MTRTSDEQKPSLLFVEDDKLFRDTISDMLEEQGYKVIACENQMQALERIIRNPDFALALIDMKIPTQKLEADPEGGMEVINAVKKYQPNAECIVITAYGNIPNVVKAMQYGASNYLVKGDSPNDLILQTVRQALEKWDLRQDNLHLQEEVRNLREQLDKKFGIANIIGQSKPMLELFEKIRHVAPTNAAVLITGESGVGKELIAEAIRNHSDRKDKPYRAINCSALNRELLESELFGHERGAFTGATNRKLGVFEQVDGGILFLDEVGDMAPETQAKFLRVLEGHPFTRLSGDKEIQVDVRVIAATNKDLQEATEFRGDLYHRLNRFPLQVPPLRDRREDIPLLVNTFITEFSEEHNKPVTGISTEAMNNLKKADWSGSNVRELRNVIETAVILATTDTIEPKDLSPQIVSELSNSRWPDAPEKALYESFKHLAMSGNSWNMIEYWLVAAALSNTNKVQSKAADLIFMSTTTLSDKIKQIKKNWEAELKDALEKRGRQQREIDEEIEDRRQKIGELKTRDEWKQFAENYLLCVKATR